MLVRRRVGVLAHCICVFACWRVANSSVDGETADCRQRPATYIYRDVDSTSTGASAFWFGKRSHAKYDHISTDERLDSSVITLVTILFTAFRYDVNYKNRVF